jgi:fatty acid desaturase
LSLATEPGLDAPGVSRASAAHLSPEDVADIERELDALRQRIIDSRGARDAAYIRRVIAVQRGLELGGRVLLLRSRSKKMWLLGTASLSLAKILENMEIGHNVLHGQWDWMRDPKIHSSSWDWDHASPPEQWKRAHNDTHHKYTNIVGHDNDLGYGIMRVAEEQPWERWHLAQPLINFVTACIFEWGIAMYDADLGSAFSSKSDLSPEQKERLAATLRKLGKQATKDYVVHPALAGRGFGHTLSANAVANLVRNVWSHSVIMCGHFPEGVETFELEELDPDESRGEWYVRQMLGSANISGSPLMHLMTGNLSHQIEHHLFPDLPSNRYAEIARDVEALFHRYGLRYHSAPLPKQVGSAWHRVVRLSLPNGWLEETNRRNWRSQLKKLTARPR